MTGLAAILPRDGAPATERDLAPLLAAMDHPGAGDPVTTRVGRGAVGVLPFPADDYSDRWGPPMVHDPESGLTVLFDGRLDGRSLLDDPSARWGWGEEALALAAQSGMGKDRARAGGRVAGSDAAAVLVAWRRWGEERVFSWIEGPFAMVVVDDRARRVVLARDPMGTRGLAYALGRQRIVVASEDAAVASAAGVDTRVDARTMAHYFALRTPEDGATFYRGVKSLRPGEVLSISLDDSQIVERRHLDTLLDHTLRLGYRSQWKQPNADITWLREIRDVYASAVHDRLQSPSGGPDVPGAGSRVAGVTLSGGLDSSAVAALAAKAVAPTRVPTFSYVFDELRACDERAWMDPLAQRWSLDATYVPADRLWPLRDSGAGAWGGLAEGPEASPYQGAMDAVYGAAAQSGVNVLLAGAFGDHLYTGAEHWLADLVAVGRLSEALGEVWRHVQRAPDGMRSGMAGVARSRSMRLAVKRAGAMATRRLGRRRSTVQIAQEAVPAWLRQGAVGYLASVERWPPGTPFFSRGYDNRREQAEMLLGGVSTGRSAALARAVARRQGVALRLPYRDIRLVGLMLYLPAWFLYHHGRAKDGLRRAMGDLREQVPASWGEDVDLSSFAEILPPVVRNRSAPTDQRPLYRRGVFEHERETVRELLERPDARWREFIDPAWLAARVPSGVLDGERNTAIPEPDSSGGMPGTEREQAVVWRCITAELWRPVR